MTHPQIGLLTFGDARQHEWENLFRGLTEPRHRQMVEYLGALPLELNAFSEVARTRTEIDAQADELKAAGVEALVAHVPCWTGPNLVVHGVQRMDLPTVLVSNKHPGTHGTVGLLGVAAHWIRSATPIFAFGRALTPRPWATRFCLSFGLHQPLPVCEARCSDSLAGARWALTPAPSTPCNGAGSSGWMWSTSINWRLCGGRN